jgi:hypothetical protein
MFPIHCAVIGGSLQLVEWMVDGQLCPISATSDPKTNHPLSVQTSANRTLVDLAMTGKPKYDILTFLLKKGLSIGDAKSPQLAGRCLEALLKSGANLSFATEPSPANLIEVESQSESVLSIEDACHICFERQTDVVFTPCVSFVHGVILSLVSVWDFASSHFFPFIHIYSHSAYRGINSVAPSVQNKLPPVRCARYHVPSFEFSSNNVTEPLLYL